MYERNANAIAFALQHEDGLGDAIRDTTHLKLLKMILGWQVCEKNHRLSTLYPLDGSEKERLPDGKRNSWRFKLKAREPRLPSVA
jgi:hypothetical protein